MHTGQQSTGKATVSIMDCRSGAALALVLAAAPASVSAQTGPALELEEVLVTARKREESLQDTPISVTTFDSSGLEDANMLDLRDIGRFTPGMSFTSYGMGSSEAGAVFIRGVGQSDHMITTDPGVGLYVDGVYMGRNMGAALDILDLERVEVLKGPQGTLFGKNTIGGTVNVISRKPGFENGGHVGLRVGEEGRLDVEATGELVAGKNLALKISALRKNRDGVGEQVFTGDETGDEDSLSLRGQLYWQGDDAGFSLVVDTFDADQGAVPHSLYDSGIGTSPCYLETAPGEYAPCAEGADADPYDSYSLDDLSTEQESFGLSGTWEWDLGGNMRFKSITAYRDMEYVGNLEFDGSPTTLVYYHETGEAEQFSQELQLLGETETVNWIAGLYYFDEEGHNLQDDDVFFSLDQRRSEVETESYAVFAHGSVAVGEAVDVTLGARYTWEEKDYDLYYQRLRAGDPDEQAMLDAGEPIYRIPPTALDDSWDALSGTLGVDYDATEELLLYAKYSRGFRSGGFNARPGNPNAVNIYDPEYVNVYEAGLKSDLLDRRLRLNLAVYLTDYEDYQAQVNQIGDAFTTRTLNAAEAEVGGVELEFNALLSAWLRLDGSFAYTDAEIEEVDIPASLEANFDEGHRLPYISEYTWSLSPRANLPLGEGSLELRADYSYRSSFYGQISNHAEEKEDGYGLWNAQIQYRPSTERWSLALYGINLADEEYTRVRNYFPGFIGFALWNTDRREIGLKGRWNF